LHQRLRTLEESTTTGLSWDWFGGKFEDLSPGGTLLHVFESTADDGTTNVAFSEDETLLREGGALRNPSAHGDFPPEVEPGADE
jgi:hypothetical protein